jgi:hypothetical protein
MKVIQKGKVVCICRVELAKVDGPVTSPQHDDRITRPAVKSPENSREAFHGKPAQSTRQA